MSAVKRYELIFLEYHLEHYNARFFKVYRNNDELLPTRVILYSGAKKKLRYQPFAGELTVSGMFKELEEDTFYSIPRVINQYKDQQPHR